MESFCPLHIDLKERACLVIGGGAVAERKVKVMLAYRAAVTVVSPAIGSYLSDLVISGKIGCINDIYRPAYLKNRFIVICATDNAEVNRKAAEDCIERGIPVNSVSEPDKCTFFLPALLKKGPLTVTVATAGSSPALSRRIRDHLDSALDPEYEAYIRYLGAIRPQVIARVACHSARRSIFEYLAGDDFFSVFTTRERSVTEDFVEQLLVNEEEKTVLSSEEEGSR